MAQFQKRDYHPDITEKHILTSADIMFLAELQKELNTQPSMGNADPLFWTIIQREEHPTAEEFSDRCVVIDTQSDNDIIARDLEGFAAFLDNGELDEIAGCAYFNGSCNIKFGDGDSDGAYSVEGVIEILQDRGVDRFEVRYVRDSDEVVKDTLFLTHKSCEDHLEKYGYNYKPDAHAYAMTAVRSPEYERLIRLVRTVDWGKLAVAGTTGDRS